MKRVLLLVLAVAALGADLPDKECPNALLRPDQIRELSREAVMAGITDALRGEPDQTKTFMSKRNFLNADMRDRKQTLASWANCMGDICYVHTNAVLTCSNGVVVLTQVKFRPAKTCVFTRTNDVAALYQGTTEALVYVFGITNER